MVRDVVLDGDQEGREDDRHVQQPADQDAEGAASRCSLAPCGTYELNLSFAFAQLENAKRIASGDLFPTSWVEFDQRAKELEERTNRQ